ncbi:MAG TPA: hypothetical protein VJL60_05370 [Gammaproteobacteria bacterium]|nr:hypothetical protein [Gammaproteobacteria bacterium]
MFFLIILSMLGYSFVITRYWRWKVEVTPVFVVSMITVVLYAAGYTPFLKIISLGLYYLGLVFFVWSFFIFYSEPRQIFSKYLTLGIIIFIVLTILLWFKVRYATLSEWDEFACWGVLAKALFLKNNLIQAKWITNLTLSQHTLGMATFYYFFYQVLGFSEGVGYFAHDMLLISSLLVLFQRLYWRDWAMGLVTVIFCYFALFAFGHWSVNHITGGQGAFLNLNPDLVVGAFAGILFAHYYLSDGDNLTFIQLLPVVFCAALFKAFGMLFAGIFILVIMADRIWQVRGLFALKRERKFLLIVLAYVALPFMVSPVSFYHHVLFHRSAQTNISASMEDRAPKRAMEKSMRQWHLPMMMVSNHAIEVKFLKAIAHQRVGRSAISGFIQEPIAITISDWLVFLFLLSFIVYVFQKNRVDQRRIILINGGLFVGLVIYLWGLLFLYLHNFSLLERSYLASFWRYTGRYFLAWALIVYAFLLSSSTMKLFSRIRVGLVILFTLLLVWVSPSMSFLFLTHSFSGKTILRQDVFQLTQIIDHYTPANARVLLVWQSVDNSLTAVNTRFAFNMILYDLFPRKLGGGYTLVSEPTPEMFDLFYRYMSPQELTQELKSFDYFLVVYPDRVFVTKYRAITGNLYKKKKLPELLLIKLTTK